MKPEGTVYTSQSVFADPTQNQRFLLLELAVAAAAGQDRTSQQIIDMTGEFARYVMKGPGSG